MRNKVLVFAMVVMVFSGCESVSYDITIEAVAPNWTSDNKVVFVKQKRIWEVRHTVSGEMSYMKAESTWLYEVNVDGSGKEEKGLLFSIPKGINSLSSAGDWVVIGASKHGEIWVVRRDGSELIEVGEGFYPDFSPDGSKIVYEKGYVVVSDTGVNIIHQGIWVMNRDGSNNHPIWGDSINRMPAWSSDGGRIALERDEGRGDRDIWIIDTSGSNRVKLLDTEFQYPIGPFVWAPADTNAIIVYNTIYYLDSFAQIDTSRGLPGASYYGWSPNGEYLIGIDTEGVFIMRVNGTNKVYINP